MIIVKCVWSTLSIVLNDFVLLSLLVELVAVTSLRYTSLSLNRTIRSGRSFLKTHCRFSVTLLWV